MKKTIIALLALSGIVVATESQKFDMKRDGDKVTFDLKEASLTNLKENALELTYTSWSYSGSGSNSAGFKNPGSYANTFSPDGQLQSGQDDCWTMNFTIKNNGKENVTLTITEFVFDCYGINGDATDKTANIPVTLTLAGTNAGVDYTATISSDKYSLAYGGSTSAATLKFTTPITLQANESMDLALTMGSAKSYNTYSGIKSGVVKYTIPEPATATLSLLALAGLAVRRRRR